MPARSTNPSPEARAVSLELKIETPENVVLTYQLAGPALRGMAFLLDTAIRFGIVMAGMMVALMALPVVGGLSLGGWFIVIFAVEWCYFIVGETLFNGKSIGKHAFGMRVIHENGRPLSFRGSVNRNLARVVDLLPFWPVFENEFVALSFLPFYGPALVAMLLTSKLQRIGDLYAGTVVVHERKVRLPREPVIVERIDPLPRDEIGGYIPEASTLALIDRFLGRRSALTHARGHLLASVLAGTLAEKLDYSGDRELLDRYPMAFLARVYVTFATVREQDEDREQEAPADAEQLVGARG